MTDTERAIMLTLIDDNMDAVPIIWRMTELTRHIAIFQYLIAQNITGKKFVQWYEHDHDKSILSIASWALKNIRGDLEKKPIYLGKDWAQ